MLLNEAREGKNVHLTHLEDLIFEQGVVGARSAIYFLLSLRNMMSEGDSNVRLSTKFDGAPAIICGTNPENGKFFVATKSAFSKNPKLNYTNADIDANHPGSGLNQKLKIALRYLALLEIKGVIQGDMMFTADDITKEKMGDDICYTFRPNTITYAVPVDSTLGKQINAAKMGIVFHTSYYGKTLADMRASFGVDLGRLKPSKFVWMRDADFKDVTSQASFNSTQRETVTKLIRECGSLFRTISSYTMNSIATNSVYGSFISRWNNKKVREGKKISDVKAHVRGLINYIEDEYNKEITKLVTQRSKENRQLEKKKVLNFFLTNMRDVERMYELHNLMVQAKLIIVKQLEKVSDLGTFVKTDSGYRVTKPEGFVAINIDGDAVKLIDRLEFSKLNFTTTKNWDR